MKKSIIVDLINKKIIHHRNLITTFNREINKYIEDVGDDNSDYLSYKRRMVIYSSGIYNSMYVLLDDLNRL